jgi:hypothetical protein
MEKPAHYRHARLLAYPGEEAPNDGILQALKAVNSGNRKDLVFDYLALQQTAQAEVFEREGKAWEKIRGEYVPRRLRFRDAKILQGESLGQTLEGLGPLDTDNRLYSALAWRGTDGVNFYLIDIYRKQEGSLFLSAQDCAREERGGESWKVEFERDWSPTPLPAERLVPNPLKLRRRFGGDPIRVRLDGRMLGRRLFIGGLDTQAEQRPDISAVLNLSEKPSLWVKEGKIHPADRWAAKGEGKLGMDAPTLAAEAGWVIERLGRGERVLVHCTAGVNRSASVCCAALILMEGISPEIALARVREQHPWTFPDPRHWLALHWLGRQVQNGIKFEQVVPARTDNGDKG